LALASFAFEDWRDVAATRDFDEGMRDFEAAIGRVYSLEQSEVATRDVLPPLTAPRCGC